MSEQQDQHQARLAKLQALQQQGNDPFAQTSYERTHSAGELTEDFEALEGQTVAVAGRLMALRGHGKASFADLRDEAGHVQLFVRLNNLGEESFAAFANISAALRVNLRNSPSVSGVINFIFNACGLSPKDTGIPLR